MPTIQAMKLTHAHSRRGTAVRERGMRQQHHTTKRPTVQNHTQTLPKLTQSSYRPGSDRKNDLETSTQSNNMRGSALPLELPAPTTSGPGLEPGNPSPAPSEHSDNDQPRRTLQVTTPANTSLNHIQVNRFPRTSQKTLHENRKGSRGTLPFLPV